MVVADSSDAEVLAALADVYLNQKKSKRLSTFMKALESRHKEHRN